MEIILVVSNVPIHSTPGFSGRIRNFGAQQGCDLRSIASHTS